MSYNGWESKETWLVNMWLQNDETSYRNFLEVLSKPGENWWLGEILQEQVFDGIPMEASGMYYDILASALYRVDWEGIVEANRDEVA